MQSDPMDYAPLDFLAIGHVCHDIAPGGHVVGGAAAYTTALAGALGCRAGIVTSAAAGVDWSEELAGIPIHRVDAPSTTVFENIYTPAGRIQTVHAVAGDLSTGHVPALWTRTPIVYLGPIANEIEPGILSVFSNSMVGVGPQGWMRRWDEKGHVFQVEWESAAEVLPLAAVTFVSTEDLADQKIIDNYARLSRLLVVTDGPGGCMVYHHNEVRAFPAPSVKAVDSTGAGDIFAAAYLVRLYQTDGDYWEAADFANRIAACSVAYRGLSTKMKAIRHLLNENTPRTTSTRDNVQG